MATIGGDLEAMARLAQVFREHSGNAQHMRSVIDGTMSDTVWTGPAADRFREAWLTFAPSLDQLRQALDEAAMEVDNRRQMLEEVSS